MSMLSQPGGLPELAALQRIGSAEAIVENVKRELRRWKRSGIADRGSMLAVKELLADVELMLRRPVRSLRG